VFIFQFSSKGEAFFIDGTSLDHDLFQMVFLGLILLNIINMVISDRNMILDIKAIKTYLLSLLPILISIPMVVTISNGLNILSISMFFSTILLSTIILLIVRKQIKKYEIRYLLIASTVLTAGCSSLFLSLRGNNDLLSISIVSYPLITGISFLVIFIIFSRFLSDLSISAKHLGLTYSLILSFIFTSLLVVLKRNIDPSLFNDLWAYNLVFMVFLLGYSFVKRSMDNDLSNTMSNNSSFMDNIERYRDEKEVFYVLHYLDMMINKNPIHGFGDERVKGNLIFKLEGKVEGEGIEISANEFVNAHCEKALLLSSRGKYQEAMREYSADISKEPKIQRTYYHLAMVQSSVSGKEKEARKNLDIYLSSRKTAIKRMIEKGLPDRYLLVFDQLFNEYIDAIHRKMDVLGELSRKGDVVHYFTLLRDS
jgi:hypothetical protein